MFDTVQVFSSKVQFNLNDQFTLETYKADENFTINHQAGSSVFAFVLAESAKMENSHTEIKSKNSLYLSSSESLKIDFFNGQAIVIRIKNLSQPNQFGTIDFKEGTLKYIDGCSDSILISPLKLGLPCLNYLYFPENTNQTKHFHPSFRFGLVADGNGYCDNGQNLVELKKGNFFYIPKNANHRFVTKDSHMSVIAFHPDSDWGPQDENHPMINRTWFEK